MKKVSKNVISKAQNIKILLSDVDGVLTKGEMILLDNGSEIKIWDIKDRMAYVLLERSDLDIKVGWISGRASKQLEKRAEELNLDFFYQGVMDKLDALNDILLKSKRKVDEIAYIGDDLLDIPILKRVGLSVCPRDAVREVKKYCIYQTTAYAGQGAFRETVELILRSQNRWKYVVSQYNK